MIKLDKKTFGGIKLEKNEINKLDLGDLVPITITLIIVGLVIAFGLDMLVDTRSDFTTGSLQYNATSDIIEATSKLSSKLPMLAGVIVIAIVIFVLVRYLGSGGMSR